MVFVSRTAQDRSAKGLPKEERTLMSRFLDLVKEMQGLSKFEAAFRAACVPTSQYPTIR